MSISRGFLSSVTPFWLVCGETERCATAKTEERRLNRRLGCVFQAPRYDGDDGDDDDYDDDSDNGGGEGGGDGDDGDGDDNDDDDNDDDDDDDDDDGDEDDGDDGDGDDDAAAGDDDDGDDDEDDDDDGAAIVLGISDTKKAMTRCSFIHVHWTGLVCNLEQNE